VTLILWEVHPKHFERHNLIPGDNETLLQRIVIVDDDPDFLEYTRIVLYSAGCQVDTAISAAEGLALIRSIHPDLAIIYDRLSGF